MKFIFSFEIDCIDCSDTENCFVDRVTMVIWIRTSVNQIDFLITLRHNLWGDKLQPVICRRALQWRLSIGPRQADDSQVET